jgi:anthranilate synthase component 1
MTFNYKTHTKKILGDLHTPVSIYLKVRDEFPQSALLESSDYHSSDNSTSYIGLHPIAHIDINRGECVMSYPGNKKVIKELSPTFTISEAINSFISQFEIEGEFTAQCGLFGYTSFNCVKYTDDIQIKDSKVERNDAPDLRYILYKYLLVFNHYKDEITLLELVGNEEESQLPRIESLINGRNFATYNFFTEDEETSTISDDEFKQYVRKGIEHCNNDDVSQIVLSRRFIQQFSGDDFKVYRALRSINPSPYLFYFDFGGFRIFGSSPETHCKIESGVISIDPIAGTAKRTGNMIEDKEATEQLLMDPKENAEHDMLVDLAKEDLSPNTQSINIDFYKEAQYYSHVIHLVSRVSGELKSGTNPLKAFFDTFPAGTLSGSPKPRAMQLISDIEAHNRGAYGGCIGFIGLNGNTNQAITIRTFVSRNNELWYQAGAGVVSMSTEEGELQEVNNKVRGLKKAIDMASSIHNI